MGGEKKTTRSHCRFYLLLSTMLFMQTMCRRTYLIVCKYTVTIMKSQKYF